MKTNKINPKEATIKKLKLFLKGEVDLPIISDIVLNSIIHLLKEEEFEKKEISDIIAKISQNNREIIDKRQQEKLKSNKEKFLSLDEQNILEEINDILKNSKFTTISTYRVLRNKYNAVNKEILELTDLNTKERINILKIKIQKLFLLMLDYMYDSHNENNYIKLKTKVLK